MTKYIQGYQLSLDLETDICKKNHRNNPFSELAHEHIKLSKNQVLSLVLEYITSTLHKGATCDEVERATGLSHQTCSARCSELKALGRVVDSGMRRPTRSLKMASVLVLPEYISGGSYV